MNNGFDNYIGQVIKSMKYDTDNNLVIELENGDILEVIGEPSYEGNHGVYHKEIKK